MVYIKQFTFPDASTENSFFMGEKRTCYDSFYPFQVLSVRGLRMLEFDAITILYGGNGSGKTTALNVIAEKAQLRRDSAYNRSNFYPDYIKLCQMHTAHAIPPESRIITSDDVFDYILNIRSLNEGIDRKRDELFGEYLDAKYAPFQLKSLDDYEQLKKSNKAKSKSQSKYVRSELMDNTREYSNGENAFRYFTEKITENGLYVLDEPENSLSPVRQLELKRFIEDSARFFGCQFIISTHSPFLLSMQDAKIYDLDEKPVTTKPWNALENVRVYHDFFREHESAFR